MTTLAEKFTVTDEQRQKVKLLCGCTFLPASYVKRFVRDMNSLINNPEATLSAKQAAFLDSTYWKYRKQIQARATAKTIPEFVNPNERKAMLGRRRDLTEWSWTEEDRLQAGDYGTMPDGEWYGMTPEDTPKLAGLKNHTVIEHDDGTITVSPSILCRDNEGAWHGYLEKGVWRAV